MARVYDPKPADQFHGKGTLNTEGPFTDVRRRVQPGLFNDIDRQWRQKWLKAQELTAREKAYHFFYLWDNPEFRKARLNPLRRLWQAPGEAFERALRPAMGLRWAFTAKYMVSKAMWATVGIWAVTYYGLFCSADWTTQGGWRYHISKPATYPHEESWPKKNPKFERTQASDYFDNGFKKNTVELKTSTPLQYHS
eukprot:TRINITY_DN42641_c0_g1_i1.p1 TRINITY_DN42641_c0_g1~~TRINITY_DN42641_c0_g1_i1.p1  ORF type:complete len:195 (+),score=38.34 TRINITY_DN42641_c0_g1_i1:35-619(+)